MQFRRSNARNPEVLALLEVYMETAKQHKMSHVAVSLVDYHDSSTNVDCGCCDYAGDIGLRKSQVENLKILTRKLEKSIDNDMFPPQNLVLDYSHVRYNVATAPLGFDFVTWLIDAEMTRRRYGAPAPLKVAFWLGKSKKLTYDRQACLEHLFRPLLPLIGAVEDDAAMYGYCKEFYCSRDIVAAARAGEEVPMLTPPNPLKFKQPPVTITLREADHWPERNSNLSAWVKFARWLQKRGEKVVFVRDTAKANEEIEGFYNYPAASVNLPDRLALYEAAKVNMFVSNGPVYLGMYGTKPWLQFIPPGDPDDEYAPNTPQFWHANQGIEIGEQFPWCGPQQRIVWARDDYANIVSAWKTYIDPPAIAKLPLATHQEMVG